LFTPAVVNSWKKSESKGKEENKPKAEEKPAAKGGDDVDLFGDDEETDKKAEELKKKK